MSSQQLLIDVHACLRKLANSIVTVALKNKRQSQCRSCLRWRSVLGEGSPWWNLWPGQLPLRQGPFSEVLVWKTLHEPKQDLATENQVLLYFTVRISSWKAEELNFRSSKTIRNTETIALQAIAYDCISLQLLCIAAASGQASAVALHQGLPGWSFTEGSRRSRGIFGSWGWVESWVDEVDILGRNYSKIWAERTRCAFILPPIMRKSTPTGPDQRRKSWSLTVHYQWFAGWQKMCVYWILHIYCVLVA